MSPSYCHAADSTVSAGPRYLWRMDFLSIRIITEGARRLGAFYEQVTGLAARWYTEDFAELETAVGTLAIAHARTMAQFAAGAARAAANQSVIIELRVADVDAEYRRIAPVIGAPLQE